MLILAPCAYREAFDSRSGGDRGSNSATGSEDRREREGYGRQEATGQPNQTLRDALETAGYVAAGLYIVWICRPLLVSC